MRFNPEFLLQFGKYGAIILFAIAIFLAFETLVSGWLARRRDKRLINERLKLQDAEGSNQAAYVELLRRRGLRSDNQFQLPLTAFNTLVMQSGVTIPIVQLVLMMAITTLLVIALVYVSTVDELFSLLIGLLAGIALPLAGLFLLRARRRKKFEEQLPEAVDVMVRSIKAGHPLPVAISLVAREMEDPIGSEFGLVADEMTYGLDLDTSMSNMRARAGQSDLSFLVVAVSIQSKSGGNLVEILTNLSRMIRERAKLRRKVHAMSAEGRFSAIGLSVIPCVIYLAINFLVPAYYGDVRSDGFFMPAVYFGLTIWSIGMFTMYRMVNFKI